MGRDALGHGHDPGESGNPNHGKGGLFSSGGSDGGSSGGHTSAGARVAFAERAKLKAKAAAKPEAKMKANKTTRAAAAKGDHQRAQAHSGRGYPVAPHMGAHSVGTHRATGGRSSGGGGSVPSGRFGSNKGPVKLRQAAKERVAIGQAVDARHVPSEPQYQTVQFGRAENVPQSKANIGRRPPGRRRG